MQGVWDKVQKASEWLSAGRIPDALKTFVELLPELVARLESFQKQSAELDGKLRKFEELVRIAADREAKLELLLDRLELLVGELREYSREDQERQNYARQELLSKAGELREQVKQLRENQIKPDRELIEEIVKQQLEGGENHS